MDLISELLEYLWHCVSGRGCVRVSTNLSILGFHRFPIKLNCTNRYYSQNQKKNIWLNGVLAKTRFFSFKTLAILMLEFYQATHFQCLIIIFAKHSKCHILKPLLLWSFLIFFANLTIANHYDCSILSFI